MPERYCQIHYTSPIGLVRFVGSDKGIVAVAFVSAESERDRYDAVTSKTDVPVWLMRALEQVREYFEEERVAFHDLPLLLEGTEFRLEIWEELLRVPYGETLTYAELARKAGHMGAARAVGGAVGSNPVSIIVPCHRVIGVADMGGYAWGTDRKDWLLRHEREVRHAKLAPISVLAE